jgi:hypothetical protein
MSAPLEEHSSKGFSISSVPVAVEAYDGVRKLYLCS